MKIPLCLMLGLTLSACAPINTQFSCNETAGDHCLSIEEVNAMTEPKVQTHERAIWLAPWADKDGRLHENDTLLIHPKE